MKVLINKSEKIKELEDEIDKLKEERMEVFLGFRAHCEKYNKSNDKIKRALEILNRPYPELTNVDKVAMAKRILEG